MSQDSTSSANFCSSDTATPLKKYYDGCTTVGPRSFLEMIQPRSGKLKNAICSEMQCFYFFDLYAQHADDDCAVGDLFTIQLINAQQMAALCPDWHLEIKTNSSTIVDPPTGLPTPTPTPEPPTIGNQSATIVGAGIGGMLLLALVYSIGRYILHRRRRQAGDYSSSYRYTGKDHAELSTPRTEPADSMPWHDSAIAAVRIPLEKIQRHELISQGGYGEVFRGTYGTREVAIKRLLAVRRKEMSNIQNFMDEVKLTASLDHESIVQFVGVAWESLADLCMITEYMPGGDLRSLLSQYMQSNHPNGYDHEKLQIAVQVAHAMTYLHSLQPVVVHRDLKSRNILLTEDLQAKVMDFGVSCECRDLTMTAGVGSSLWMSPEVMLGERYDQKADVFSFGIVLSELDTHELPYAHAKETSSERKMPEMAVLQLVTQGRLTARFSEQADPEIVALANECLQIDPKARPTSAEVLHRVHKYWRNGTLV